MLLIIPGEGDSDDDEAALEWPPRSLLLKENLLTTSGLGLGDRTGGFRPPSEKQMTCY